jgi:putative transposase
VWSRDSVSDQLNNYRRFHSLTIVDDSKRECLALVAGTSPSGLRTGRERDAIISRRRKPVSIVSDNGTELTSIAMLNLCQQTMSVALHRAW